MKITYYEDRCFYYFWKNAGIPSVFGKGKSFLDLLLENDDRQILPIVDYLKDMFGVEGELGLVNRLDNDTSGLLYFAKTPLFKERYKEAQNKGQMEKIYLADVYGEFPWDEKVIDDPIGNHRFNADRVVVISDKEKESLVKGKINSLETKVERLYYDEKENISTLLIRIKKGFRHQIRAHLSSIGYSIVGEKIYIKKKKECNLRLFCVGLKDESL